MSIQVGLKVTMRWGCEFLISIVDLGRKSRKLGNKGRGGQRYVSRVRPRKQDAVDTVGTMEYRGAGEFRAHVSLVFPGLFSLPTWPDTGKRRATGGVPNKRNNNNTCPPAKVHTPQRYVPPECYATPAAHTQAAITETGPVTATGERQGARNYGKSLAKRKQTIHPWCTLHYTLDATSHQSERICLDRVLFRGMPKEKSHIGIPPRVPFVPRSAFG